MSASAVFAEAGPTEHGKVGTGTGGVNGGRSRISMGSMGFSMSALRSASTPATSAWIAGTLCPPPSTTTSATSRAEWPRNDRASAARARGVGGRLPRGFGPAPPCRGRCGGPAGALLGRVDERRQVHEGTQTLVVQSEQPLDDDRWRRLDVNAARRPCLADVVVAGHFDGATREKLPDVGDEQLRSPGCRGGRR